uniref:sulfotransferase 4A1-like n=1 Tax=Myxine glutinosa TaxID=7769 RepID=UPI00358E3E75
MAGGCAGGWLDGKRYYDYRGVRLPPFCRDRMDDIAAFPVREDDLWIVTYPKSGSRLLQELVFLLSQGPDPDDLGLMNIAEQIPILEYPQPGLDILKELKTARIIKSHLPYQFLPTGLQSSPAKVVYLARNPKDLVVSYYHFHRSLRSMRYRGTFPDFCHRFLTDKLGYGSWFKHVSEFWKHKQDSNILFLKHEDFHKNLDGVISALSTFLSVSYTQEQMDAILNYCQELANLCCSSEALPMNQGCVGRWKDLFTVSLNEKFDDVYRQQIPKEGLAFDFQLS